MSALSLLSLALLLVALGGCAVLWSRSGETRAGLFGALFLLVAIHQAIAPWTEWNAPLAWNLSSFVGLAGVAAGVIAVLVVVALWRTLEERDRAEKLHWDSMETVRILNELGERESIPLDAKLATLLEMGSSRFDLEVAIAARVRADRYEVVAIHAPESFPVRVGADFSLDETFCEKTLESERPVGIERIPESNRAGVPDRPAFPFSAYLGAAIACDGARWGTLSFASLEPRKERFNATEKDLVHLMAQWIGSELGRRGDARAPAERAIEVRAPSSTARRPDAAARSAPAPRSSTARRPRAEAVAASAIEKPPSRGRRRADPRYGERVIDPNRILRRIGGELRALAGSSVNLVMKLDPDLGFAAAQNLPFKAIVRTLVMNARDAMPEGGELVIETANLEIAAREPDQMPTLAPNRYATLSISDSGRNPDAEALSRIFERAPSDAERSSLDDRLALPTVYRVLQICGGDLSVKLEPGCGSTFTVYLPQARDPVRAPRAAAPPFAPVISSSAGH